MNVLRIILPLLLLLISCEKEDMFSDQFSFMYGDWSPRKISSMSIQEPSEFCDLLRLSHPNKYSLLIDNSIVDAGIMNIGELSDQKLNIVFKSENKPDKFHSVPGFHNIDLEVTILSQDSIKMNNTVTDFGYISIWLKKI
jgi:hypothetical protein